MICVRCQKKFGLMSVCELHFVLCVCVLSSEAQADLGQALGRHCSFMELFTSLVVYVL